MTVIPLLVFFTKVNNNALKLHVKQWHYINGITLMIRLSPSTTLFNTLTRSKSLTYFVYRISSQKKGLAVLHHTLLKHTA